MEKSEITIQTDNDLLGWDDNDEPTLPLYCVRYTKFFPYKDRDNYLCHREETDELKATSIAKLYEHMGQEVVDHMIHGEKESKNDPWEHPRDEFKVEFSHIYIEVEYYDENKMKNSESYSNIGAAKEKARILEAEQKAAEEKRAREWREKEKERIDREEFARLSKKYSK